MSNSKISALTSATTPLAGTEVLPIVQSSATTQVTVANLTAGRAVSATQYTSTIATGTAPLVVTSTTNVANLNASSLGGATFAAPGAIGGGTASAITGTTITGTDTTDATSTTAAALKTAGGLGVAKKAYFGDSISATSVTATAGAFINSSTAGTASLDVSGNTLTLANLATVTFSNFSGLIAVNCASVGSSTLYIAGGGTVTQIGTAGVAQGTLLYNAAANGYRWTNTSGAAFIFSFCAIRLRTAA